MDGERGFSMLVAGENHKKIMDNQTKKFFEQPQLMFSYSNAESMKKVWDTLYDGQDKEYAEKIKTYSTEEFWEKVLFKDIYEEDKTAYIEEKTMDIYAKANRQRISGYRIGDFACPVFVLKNGEESFQARKKDIDWDVIHGHNRDTYARVWEMVIRNDSPKTPSEKLMFENMKTRKDYLLGFKNKKRYVGANSSFYCEGFADDTSWKECELEDEMKWRIDFYDKFIKKLPDDILLTIYYCTV